MKWMYVAAAAALISVPAVASTRQANDQQTLTEVQKILDAKRFGGVQVAVADGVVTLNGQVDTLADKVDAEKKVLKDHYVASVHNQLQVAIGEKVSDAELQAKLSRKLIYDRVGYGTTMFNAITLQVQNGVATIGGVVVEPADKDSALSLIETTPGIQGLVDKLQVAPLSGFDNRVRLDEARAIYGFGQLSRYALDPAKPIRISVVNGHVTLVGVVDTESDREIANVRANGVSGVFSVTNDLQVAGHNER